MVKRGIGLDYESERYILLISKDVPSNLSTIGTLWTEESGHCGEVAIMERKGCNITNVFKEYNMFIECSYWSHD